MVDNKMMTRFSFNNLLIFIAAFGAVSAWTRNYRNGGHSNQNAPDNVWKWECSHEAIRNLTVIPRCKKVHRSEASSKATELSTCKLTCGEASMLFPKPSGKTKLSKKVVPFAPYRVKLSTLKLSKNGKFTRRVNQLIRFAFGSFKRTLHQGVYRQQAYRGWNLQGRTIESSKRSMEISIILETNAEKLTLYTDESYSLKVNTNNRLISVTIKANNFFGARHALETLSQLTAYHQGHNSLQIIDYADIYDKPAYPYRGVLLDTSRNFYSVPSIRRLIKTMSYNKLNTFHWHITDTHSFPIFIKAVPQLTQYGAYSNTRVYTPRQVKQIAEYGRQHGVRVLPEFDQPAHTGEGWQFGEKEGLGKLAVCVNKEPWQKFCLEPPCGQLNPINQNLYHILSKIYKEYFDLFDPDLFHAGGDEINFNCWNTTKEITDWLHTNYGGRNEEEMMRMWNLFLEKSSKKIYEANDGKEIPLILWTSKMTSIKYLNRFLNPKQHIIQIWTSTKSIVDIVNNGFKTIFTNWNTLYLDCGVGSWVGEGNNWCSPYKDWKQLYDNDPIKILKDLNVNVTAQIRKNILGQEAPLWSEQADESVSEAKIWPRAAALAERLWTNPEHNWRKAEYRLVYHRQRLVNRGIRADALQPLWCKQNSGHCYYDPTVV
ncbi:chitooligosaccharidolytic beta-N-acetylglucosaminidase-like [Clytia hemisphaerica]|uniref:chitooligosaccharidolytic beta-N-acetylglucosaminidase-like n=1 Tax=Clytia hemisphaerica TaxID=252671 RepID=UPI0034D6FF68